MPFKFKEVFLGISFRLSDDRKNVVLHVSINDGLFCIDTQELHFKIEVKKDTCSTKHNLSIKNAEDIDELARYSFSLNGIVTLPQSLHCDHFYEDFKEDYEIEKVIQNSVNDSLMNQEDIKKFIENFIGDLEYSSSGPKPNVFRNLIDHLNRTVNLTKKRNDQWRICKKCDRITTAKDSITVGNTATTAKSGVSEQILEYEIEHYEDTSFKILNLLLSQVFDSYCSFLNLYIEKNNLKVIGIGYSVAALKYELRNKVQYYTWHQLDALPCFFESTREDYESESDSFARRVTRLIGFNNRARLYIDQNNKVGVDNNCICLSSLYGYRIALLEGGEKKLAEKYKNKQNIAMNKLISDNKNSHIKEITQSNQENKNSNVFVREGYQCDKIDDSEKKCYKCTNLYDKPRIEYKNNYGTIINDLILISRAFKDKVISFISSTPQGGGVALMRHAHIRFYRLLGMKVHWYVTVPIHKVFMITKKKFHNVLQGVYLHKYEWDNEKGNFKSITTNTKEDDNSHFLTDNDKSTYEKWIKFNSDRHWNETVFKESDIIVLDDHQTAGFIPMIRKINKKVKLIYRSHIQIRGELYESNNVIKNTWDYISNNFFEKIDDGKKKPLIDLFIAHPMNSAVPSNIPEKLVCYLPASTDLLDGLNKKMSDMNWKYYQNLFDEACIQSECDPVNLSEINYLLQVSRFDPSKGLYDCIEVFYEVTKHFDSIKKNNSMAEESDKRAKNLHLILAGQGSVDDPESVSIFNYLKKYISQKKFDEIRNRIKLVMIKRDRLLNFLMTKSLVVLQLSINEGFEVKVTEALLHQKPVVVSNCGGIPLQTFDGLSGFICSNRLQMIEKVIYIITNYEMMLVNIDSVKELGLLQTTPFNIMGWFKIFKKVLYGENGNKEIIYESIIKKYFKEKEQKMLLEKSFRNLL